MVPGFRLNGRCRDEGLDLDEMLNTAPWARSASSLGDSNRPTSMEVMEESVSGGVRPKIILPGTEEEVQPEYLNFFDYECATFHAIRQILGVTGEDYQAAFKDIVDLMRREDNGQVSEN